MHQIDPYHLITHTLMLKPRNEGIYSERATRIRLADEAGGLFVEVVQEYTSNQPQSENCVQITDAEWPLLREAIDRQFAQIALLESPRTGAPE